MRLSAGDIVEWCGARVLVVCCSDRLALCLPWPVPDVYFEILEEGGDITFNGLPWPVWDSFEVIAHVDIDPTLGIKLALDVPVIPIPVHRLAWPEHSDEGVSLEDWSGPPLWGRLQAAMFPSGMAIVVEGGAGLCVEVSPNGHALSGVDILKSLIRDPAALGGISGRRVLVRSGMRGQKPTYDLVALANLAGGSLLERSGCVPNTGSGFAEWTGGRVVEAGDVFEVDGSCFRVVCCDSRVLICEPWATQRVMGERREFQRIPTAMMRHLQWTGVEPISLEDQRLMWAQLPPRPIPMIPYTWRTAPSSKQDMAMRLGHRVASYELENGYSMPCDRMVLYSSRQGVHGRQFEVRARTSSGFTGLDMLMAAVETQAQSGEMPSGGLGLLRTGVVDGAPSFVIEDALGALSDVWV